MNHHDTAPATGNMASRDPADLSAYIPKHLVPANRDKAYSSAKLAWLRDHPAATSQQVEDAWRTLAEMVGL